MSGCCHISPVRACWFGWVSAVSDPHGSRRSHVSVRRLSVLLTFWPAQCWCCIGHRCSHTDSKLCRKYQFCSFISLSRISAMQMNFLNCVFHSTKCCALFSKLSIGELDLSLLCLHETGRNCVFIFLRWSTYNPCLVRSCSQCHVGIVQLN